MKKVKTPKVSERIRGVTLPDNNILFVCDYDEVFKITLSDKTSYEVLDDDPYDFLNKQSKTIGVLEHPLIHDMNESNIAYNFVSANDSVIVHYDIKGKKGEIEFPTLSGDWFGASFSACGKYLVMAEPYSFEVYDID